MSECLRFTDENFEREVLQSGTPVLVDFWGSWCPPCKMMEPVVKELAREFAGEVKVGKINVDRNKLMRSEFDVQAAPTFILFEGGRPVRRVIGAQSRKQLSRMISESLVDSAAPRGMESVQAGAAAPVRESVGVLERL